ncbi:MAG TPA: hypothetical protein VFQ53_21470 [Kofleriaceae bacterium]|nr:hypothetical protein [Kofleriaceae bacterium]
MHPIAKSQGGGMCYIEGPHVHVYAADKVQYRDHDGSAYFVGDPVAYGYEGPRYQYKGHHPIHVEAVVGGSPDVEYCYLDGPHYHYFVPPEGPEFKVVGDTYFYVTAEPPAAYVEARPAYIGINAMYRPLVYARPVVTVEAPVGWIGAGVVVGGPGVVVAPPAAVVTTPGVRVGAEVAIPVPSVHVDVGIGGGVIVRDRGPRYYKHKKFKRGRH